MEALQGLSDTVSCLFCCFIIFQRIFSPTGCENISVAFYLPTPPDIGGRGRKARGGLYRNDARSVLYYICHTTGIAECSLSMLVYKKSHAHPIFPYTRPQLRILIAAGE